MDECLIHFVAKLEQTNTTGNHMCGIHTYWTHSFECLFDSYRYIAIAPWIVFIVRVVHVTICRGSMHASMCACFCYFFRSFVLSCYFFSCIARRDVCQCICTISFVSSQFFSLPILVSFRIWIYFVWCYNKKFLPI